MGFGIQYGKSWKNSKKIHAMQEFNCLCGVCEFGVAEPEGTCLGGGLCGVRGGGGSLTASEVNPAYGDEGPLTQIQIQTH